MMENISLHIEFWKGGDSKELRDSDAFYNYWHFLQEKRT